MAGSFVCTMISSAKPGNAALVTDTVSVHFSDPPDAATDVTIELIQADTSKVVTTFKGAFVGKVFKSSIIIGNTFVSSKPLKPDDPDPDLDQLVDMVITFNVDGKSKCKVRMSDPPSVAGGGGPTNLENKLKIKVSGTVTGGGQQTFEGQSVLHIFYPQVMIVPSGPVVTGDDALKLIPKWATQWKKAHKEMRTIVSLPIIIPPSRRKPSRDLIVAADYDAVVAAVKTAVTAAPGGIIALAVGHGDGGQGQGRNTPWCDLAAEDGKQDEHTYFRDLSIDMNELRDGSGGTRDGVNVSPGQATIVKLNGMDRMADLLTPTDPDAPRLRKLLLHTCNAGNSEEFMQMMANRLRVRVQAHVRFIELTNASVGSIQAHYPDEDPINPEALQEWLSAHTSKEYYPSQNPPPRFNP